MEQSIYKINKGVNRQVEFKGLKAQYIYYLAFGLAVLLVAFAVMYIAGVPAFICVTTVLLAGGGLFALVYRYSNKYGAYGLMKAMAYRQVPSAITIRSSQSFSHLQSRPLADG